MKYLKQNLFFIYSSLWGWIKESRIYIWIP